MRFVYLLLIIGIGISDAKVNHGLRFSDDLKRVFLNQDNKYILANVEDKKELFSIKKSDRFDTCLANNSLSRSVCWSINRKTRVYKITIYDLEKRKLIFSEKRKDELRDVHFFDNEIFIQIKRDELGKKYLPVTSIYTFEKGSALKKLIEFVGTGRTYVSKDFILFFNRFNTFTKNFPSYLYERDKLKILPINLKAGSRVLGLAKSSNVIYMLSKNKEFYSLIAGKYKKITKHFSLEETQFAVLDNGMYAVREEQGVYLYQIKDDTFITKLGIEHFKEITDQNFPLQRLIFSLGKGNLVQIANEVWDVKKSKKVLEFNISDFSKEK